MYTLDDLTAIDRRLHIARSARRRRENQGLEVSDLARRRRIVDRRLSRSLGRDKFILENSAKMY